MGNLKTTQKVLEGQTKTMRIRGGDIDYYIGKKFKRDKYGLSSWTKTIKEFRYIPTVVKRKGDVGRYFEGIEILVVAEEGNFNYRLDNIVIID